MRTGPKDVLPPLERSHIRGACIRGPPPTDTRQASSPGNTMAPRTWDPMQEQAPPGFLPPVAPPEPPHLMDPAREAIGLGSWVRRRQGGRGKCDSRAHALQPGRVPVRAVDS
eukprot:424194-Pelagomonas_calceolata.AAC.1